MNPYRELGVHPTASIEEIEARYRLLMREHHPDFHQDKGERALAEAERRTRNLNWAMERIREDRGSEGSTPAWTWDDPSDDARYRDDATAADEWTDARRNGPWAGDNPFWRPPGDRRETTVNNDTRARDWQGNAIPNDDPVPCPFCRQPFDRLADYERHLQDQHNFRQRPAADAGPPRTNRFFQAIGVIRFIPAWLVLLVAIAFWAMLGFYWFLGVVAFLALVLLTQTSKWFRGR